jgi:hypothetical protein
VRSGLQRGDQSSQQFSTRTSERQQLSGRCADIQKSRRLQHEVRHQSRCARKQHRIRRFESLTLLCQPLLQEFAIRPQAGLLLVRDGLAFLGISFVRGKFCKLLHACGEGRFL